MEDASPSISTYGKVPFGWDPARALDDDERDDASWLAAEKDDRLLDVVAGVLTDSPDASDVSAVAAVGPRDAARHLLEAPPRWRMSRGDGWWSLLCLDDEVAGFVLPVTYDDGAGHGRDEASIFHMGVLPRYRGRGLGRALLRQATRLLVHHGVWRISCDTAADNGPMIHLFESEHWRRLPSHQRPVLHLYHSEPPPAR